MAPRVFIVQQPSRFDKVQNKWVSKYDLSAANEFGEIEILFGPGNIQLHDLDSIIEMLHTKLAGMTSDDSLLAVMGDPVASTLAIMVATKITGGNFKILKFDRITNKYKTVQLKI